MEVLSYLLVSDLDGTLQKAHDELRPYECSLLEELMRNNGFLVLITGAPAESIQRRVLNGINPSFYNKMIFYSNYGSCCFCIDSGGKKKIYYSFEDEFSIYKQKVIDLAISYSVNNNLGNIDFCPGRVAKPNHVCIDCRECLITIALEKQETKRNDMLEYLKIAMGEDLRQQLRIQPAGKGAIDIYLSHVGKAFAITHLITLLPIIGYEESTKVIIAGDSFGPNGSDLEMLHEKFAGAVVFCAGETMPFNDKFLVIKSISPSYEETYSFLAHYIKLDHKSLG